MLGYPRSFGIYKMHVLYQIISFALFDRQYFSTHVLYNSLLWSYYIFLYLEFHNLLSVYVISTSLLSIFKCPMHLLFLKRIGNPTHEDQRVNHHPAPPPRIQTWSSDTILLQWMDMDCRWVADSIFSPLYMYNCMYPWRSTFMIVTNSGPFWRKI